MSANNALHIAVLSGDGIGPEVMAPALEVLRKIENTTDLKFRFTDAPAGANHYRETGKSMPESTVRLCDEADAILLGACGLPSVRYPDNTEIMPQVELRFHFDLYAGVRPARVRRVISLDGFGIRTLIGDSHVPLNRAREAVEESLARDLGLGTHLVTGAAIS